MPDQNFRRINWSETMEPNNRQQLEGPLMVKFKLALLDLPQVYKIAILEEGSDDSIILHETKYFDLAAEFYRRYVHNIIKSNMYQMTGTKEGPKRDKVVSFELSVLPTWSYGNGE